MGAHTTKIILTALAVALTSVSVQADSGQTSGPFADRDTFPLNVYACSSVYGELNRRFITDQHPSLKDAKADYATLVDANPDFAKVDFLDRRAQLLRGVGYDATVSDEANMATMGTMKWFDVSGLISVYELPAQLEFSTLEFDGTGQPAREKYKPAFTYLSACDSKYGIYPLLNLTVGLQYGVRSKTTPAPAAKPAYTFKANSQACGGRYYFAAEVLKARDPHMAQTFYDKTRTLLEQDSGSKDPRTHQKYLQKYINAAQPLAHASRANTLNGAALKSEIDICDAEYKLEATDITPYLQ